MSRVVNTVVENLQSLFLQQPLNLDTKDLNDFLCSLQNLYSFIIEKPSGDLNKEQVEYDKMHSDSILYVSNFFSGKPYEAEKLIDSLNNVKSMIFDESWATNCLVQNLITLIKTKSLK